ncbi:ABC transporter substrate-binding protein [Ruminococcus gauvreauii]|uniref:ABC transporter substrate-binding protein n=1 Tax=Ruminococcus gauvreauii TaxID=438033 RepID=A0ABY5VKJ4_9FIRM|nr:ABC transporter substrate-binding protein [Ruminococcus gauvreauii]UWP60817.1 ABC transporter substrate-binding protein [Ruminococcus gauvreauii]
MKKLVAFALIGTLAVSLLTGCGQSGSEKDSGSSANESGSDENSGDGSESKSGGSSGKHTIAASIPLTGNLMQYGISYQNALKMAVEDFNAAGGLNGEDVILEINDDKGDQKEAINLANKIIEEDDVFAVVGSFGSSVSMAAAPVYQKASMPMISPNTSHPDFPGMGDMLIPVSPIADIERTATAKMLYDQFDGKDLAILHQNTDLGVTGAQILTEVYEELGGKVVMTDNFVPQQTKDFTPLISKIKEAKPGILYIDGEYNDVANILIQIDNIGLDGVQIAGPGNVFKQEFLDIAGEKANGIVLAGTTPVYLDSIMQVADYTDYLKDFTTRYNEKYPDTPCDGFAASAYDSAMLAMTAAKNVGTDDPKALVEEMLTVPIEITSGKNMSFENGNNVVKDVFVYTVIDGEFAPYDY